MYGNITGRQFINNTVLDMNQYVVLANFSQTYLYERLNDALFYLLNYRKRYRNVTSEELGDGVTDLSTYTATYRPKLVEFCYDNAFIEMKKLTTQLGTSQGTNRYKTNGATITLGKPVNKLYLQYEKYFTRYDATNIDTELPIPPEYNDALTKKFLTMVSGIWLGEGMGSLMGVFKGDYADTLNNLAKTDSYDNPVDTFISKRYSNSGVV